MNKETYTYGNSPRFAATSVVIRNSLPVKQDIEVDRVSILPGNYLHALNDINETWDVLEDKQTGKTFEIAIANEDADPEQGVDMEMSTFSSSLSGNVGNAVEFAEHAALHPDRQRLYVASFGNGKSSYWSADEQRYIKRTGRFIDQDGKPLPTIAALARVLQRDELAVTRASTNSAGGAYATALMQALPEGQITHAYFKSRPNISNHPTGLLWGMGVLLGDQLDDIRFRGASRDPWKMTSAYIVGAELKVPRIYSPEDELNEAKSIPEATNTYGLKKMWIDMLALARGTTTNKENPAAKDTVEALKRHPEVLLTYHFPTKDRLYNSQEDIIHFLERIHHIGKFAFDSQVEALIVPGAHRDHTSYPALRWSFESYAFSKKPADWSGSQTDGRI